MIMNNKETKEEFEKKYAENSVITLEEYRESFITLPCNCDYLDWEHWACCINEERAIKIHLELYGQRMDDYE